MPQKILKRIEIKGHPIASLVHSTKIDEDVWVIHERQIFDLIKDARTKYSQQEVKKVAELEPAQLKKVNDAKKIMPGAEVLKVS